MSETPRSNRPTPRTAASVEAELRRRIRTELTQARSDAENGQVDDATLAGIIASAIGDALGWHLESPEHTRNATLSSKTWRPAGGPRGGRSADDEDAPGAGGDSSFSGDRPPRRDFGDRPPRREFGNRPQRDFGDRPPRRNFGDQPPRRDFGNKPPRDFGDRPPRGGFGNRPGRDFGDRPPRPDFSNRPGRDFGDRPPRDVGDDRDAPRRESGRPPFSPRGGRPPNRGGAGGGFSRGGGFGPRRPPRPR